MNLNIKYLVKSEKQSSIHLRNNTDIERCEKHGYFCILMERKEQKNIIDREHHRDMRTNSSLSKMRIGTKIRIFMD